VDPTDVIELAFPASPDLLVLARLVTGAIASRVGFDVEEIDDLKLAVDELCVSSMGSATRGTLNLRFTAGDNDIHISSTFAPEMEGVTAVEETPDNGRSHHFEAGADLSERILEALVDEYGRSGNGPGATTWLSKRCAPEKQPGTAS
jgi:serine/threonine-protein kinase RsbW